MAKAGSPGATCTCTSTAPAPIPLKGYGGNALDHAATLPRQRIAEPSEERQWISLNKAACEMTIPPYLVDMGKSGADLIRVTEPESVILGLKRIAKYLISNMII